ncbi:MAG: YggS family pyridoxal phosphate-dependent enzyme [Paludibacteraceae bacterium]|jgi:pyridoxal phosphate enzyme (YggS family)|nr:YggS family pyridoxal phosphate-dependent enzyme [Paludibacteraceae bacterium]MEE0996289.1 YggS family pyridoxal phosphate-dependent enzyme [Paludibacteraceae bacterium]
MSGIAERIQSVVASLPETARLVAVSKFNPAEAVLQAYNCGQRLFGESKVQELTGKYEVLPKDIEWHFIGHLQTNKVKYIAPFISLIQSVDSLKLLKEIDAQAKKVNRVIDCLLEIHVAQEETKYGFSFDELRTLFKERAFDVFENVSVVGLMGMASNTEDEVQIREEFRLLSDFYKEMKDSLAPQFRELSMGMSHDYHIAVEEGSTLVRVGSFIFGERVYA